MPVTLSTAEPDFEPRFAALLAAKREDSADVGNVVAAIIDDVRQRGDAALVELTARFDRVMLKQDELRFSRAEIDAAADRVAPAEAAALDLAAQRIRAYHERQLPADERWTDAVGAELGWRWSPVSAAGSWRSW